MVTGMSPERLAAIRANLPSPDLHLHDAGVLSRRERDALDLLAEVKRLRAGIEDIEAKADDYGQQTLVNMANALLNPTEGETDDR